MSQERARVHLLISGLVQGVSYRAHAQRHAASYRLTGWVRNLRSGQVELMAEGPRAALEQLIAWCRGGPACAQVSSVAVRWEEGFTDEMSAFEIRPTA